MRWAALVIVLVAWAARAQAEAGSGWSWEAPSKADVALHGAAVGVLLVDMGQTLARRGDELNLLLGPAPSDGLVRAYFIGWIVGTTVAWIALPPKLRRWASMSVLAVEVPTCAWNVRMAGGFRWRF